MTTFDLYLNAKSGKEFTVHCPVCLAVGTFSGLREAPLTVECLRCGQEWTMSVDFSRLAACGELKRIMS